MIFAVAYFRMPFTCVQIFKVAAKAALAVNTHCGISSHTRTHSHSYRTLRTPSKHTTPQRLTPPPVCLPLWRVSGVKLKAFSVATEGHLNCFRFATAFPPLPLGCFDALVFSAYFFVVFLEKIIKNAWPYIFLLLTQIALLFLCVCIELSIRSGL